MSNYLDFKEKLEAYFKSNGIIINIETTLKDSSYNEKGNNYLYTGKKNLSVISMDSVAQEGYKALLKANGRPLNSVDAFLVDNNGEWFFIEFKDCKISTKKDNIEKKGMANLLMLMDVMLDSSSGLLEGYSNPFIFAREKITYILVCSREKDPYSYDQIRICDNLNQKYTPQCLEKLKYYFFKDAYVYTEEYFERRFVNNFAYD